MRAAKLYYYQGRVPRIKKGGETLLYRESLWSVDLVTVFWLVLKKFERRIYNETQTNLESAAIPSFLLWLVRRFVCQSYGSQTRWRNQCRSLLLLQHFTIVQDNEVDLKSQLRRFLQKFANLSLLVKFIYITRTSVIQVKNNFSAKSLK